MCRDGEDPSLACKKGNSDSCWNGGSEGGSAFSRALLQMLRPPVHFCRVCFGICRGGMVPDTRSRIGRCPGAGDGCPQNKIAQGRGRVRRISGQPASGNAGPCCHSRGQMDGKSCRREVRQAAAGRAGEGRKAGRGPKVRWWPGRHVRLHAARSGLKNCAVTNNASGKQIPAHLKVTGRLLASSAHIGAARTQAGAWRRAAAKKSIMHNAELPGPQGHWQGRAVRRLAWVIVMKPARAIRYS